MVSTSCPLWRTAKKNSLARAEGRLLGKMKTWVSMKTVEPRLLLLTTWTSTSLSSFVFRTQSLPTVTYPAAVLQVVQTSPLLHVEHFSGQVKQVVPDWYCPDKQEIYLMQEFPLRVKPEEHSVQVVDVPSHFEQGNLQISQAPAEFKNCPALQVTTLDWHTFPFLVVPAGQTITHAASVRSPV